MDSFKDLLAETVGQIKRANEDSAEQQIKINRLTKFCLYFKYTKAYNVKLLYCNFQLNGFKTRRRAFAPLT